MFPFLSLNKSTSGGPNLGSQSEPRAALRSGQLKKAKKKGWNPCFTLMFQIDDTTQKI